MPVTSKYSGIWAVGIDLAAPIGGAGKILCDNISHDFSLDISPSSLLSGSGNMLIHKIGNLTASYGVSGPLLVGEIGAKVADNVYDAFDYASYLPMPTYQNMNGVWWQSALQSKSFSISGDSNKMQAKWFAEPGYTNGVGNYLGDLWAARKVLTTAYREASWYDFNCTPAGLVKQADVNVTFNWDTFNPIGGSAVLAGTPLANPITGTTGPVAQRSWHLPIRIFTGLSITYTCSAIMDIYSLTHEYGGYTYNPGSTIYVSSQPQDIHEYLKVMPFNVTLPPAPGTLPRILTSANSVMSDAIFGNPYGSSGAPFNIIGWYIRSVNDSIVPGICTSTIVADAICAPV